MNDYGQNFHGNGMGIGKFLLISGCSAVITAGAILLTAHIVVGSGGNTPGGGAAVQSAAGGTVTAQNGSGSTSTDSTASQAGSRMAAGNQADKETVTSPQASQGKSAVTSSSGETETTGNGGGGDSSSDEDPAFIGAYLDCIEENHFDEMEDCEFQLIYIDGDDTPEMYINTQMVAAGAKICTYDGEKVVSVDLDATGYFKYIEKGGTFYASGGRQGGYYDEVYQLKNGTFTQIARGTYFTDAAGGSSEKYDLTWNGQSVSEDQYHQDLEGAFKFSSAADINDTTSLYYGDFYDSLVIGLH